MKKKISAALIAVLGALAMSAHAQPEAPPDVPGFHYQAKCRMYQGKAFKFEGVCKVNFGRTKGVPFVRALVTPPDDGQVIEVRVYPKHTGTIDGTPGSAELINGWWHISVSDDNDLWITDAPKDAYQR